MARMERSGFAGREIEAFVARSWGCFAILLLSNVVWAADNVVETWEIPALSYGPDRWSVLKLRNASDFPRSVLVSVWDSRGTKLPIDPVFELAPGQTTEIRIEPSGTSKKENSSAAITTVSIRPGELRVEAFVEVLKGNQIEVFERPPAQPENTGFWFLPRKQMDGNVMYFLNAGTQKTEVSFCWVETQRQGCTGKGTNRFVIEPRASILVAAGKGSGDYFSAQPAARGRNLVVLIAEGPGDRKTFSSESAIRFGDTAK
jgi:hypothetical protein